MLRQRFSHPLGWSAERLFFSPDGSWLVAAAPGRAVLLDARTGAAREYADRCADRLAPESFTADGSRLVLAGPAARVVETASGRDLIVFDPSPTDSIGISVDGSAILVLSRGEVTVYDGRTGDALWSPGVERSGSGSVGGWSWRVRLAHAALRADGRAILGLGEVTYAEWGIARHHGEADEQVTHSELLWLLPVADDGSECRLDSEDTGQRLHLGGVAFSPVSPHVVTLSECETELRLHEAGNLESWLLFDHDRPVVGAWVALAGARVATLDDVGTARLWLADPDVGRGVLLEQVVGAAVDPLNAFGLVPTRYRILSVEGVGTLVEAWPARQATALVREFCFQFLAVQPGSGGRVFAGIDEDGAVGVFAVEE